MYINDKKHNDWWVELWWYLQFLKLFNLWFKKNAVDAVKYDANFIA